MRLRPILICAVALLLAAGGPAAGQQEEVVDELKLQAAGLATDGPGLLEFFKQRTVSTVSRDKLAALIDKLADKDADERGKAYRELVGLGPLAIPALRLAVSDPDSSAASALARRCLGALQGDDAADVPALAARVLAKRRPRGAAEALLAYVPFADNDTVLGEVKQALVEVGYEDGKPDAAVVSALEDKAPLRRALAIDVLAARGGGPREVMRKLLADPRPSVRLRAALALAKQKDPKAVSTLIVLMAELPYSHAREAEDFLLEMAGEQAPKAPLGPEDASREKARDAWAEWWLKSEGPGVLDEVRKRTMTEISRDQALALIKELGAENFRERKAAYSKLKEMGVLVLPLLRKASTDDKDPEVKTAAKECLAEIEKNQPGPLSPVVAKLIAFRKPEGAAEALIKFVPFADDEAVLTEVQAALNAVAYADGKPAAVLVEALADKIASRRAAAAEALAQPGAGDKELAEVRKLLKDADGGVRLKAAIALAGARQRDAVPVLIDLLAELPADQAFQAEDYLARVAGDGTPAGELGTDDAARKKRSEAWAQWWKDKGDKVRLLAAHELPREERLLGYTMLISPNQSRVAEIDKAGKVRWEIVNVSNVWDAQMLSRNRVLLLESGMRRLTERNLRGDVLWTQAIPGGIWPTGAQRMPNGNTFLTSNNRLTEVSRDGKEVWSHNRPQGDILAGRKFKDGQVTYVTSNSTVHKLDATGRETKTWRIQNPTNQGIHILPNGNVLFPQQHNGRVCEYDSNGKQVWTATVPNPVSAQRLPNGNTLIASNPPRLVTEVDRSGKEVWKQTTQIQPMRAYRR